MTHLRRWRGGCDWCWAVDKKTCSQLILTVTAMVTSACHAMVTKHKQHCVILHQLGDIPEKRNEVNMFTALVIAMQKPLCLAWDTLDSWGVHHFKSKMHS